jgi:hypothetical protein
MTSPWSDDERLLAALGDAVRAAEAVPPDFLAAAQAAYTWRDIDAELAALTYDSALEQDREPAGTRAQQAGLRALTFVSAHLSIELEVGRESCLGQLVPAQPGRVEVQVVTGEAMPVTVDEVGFFVVRPVPAGWFRLRCHTAEGADVVTGWVVS